MEEIWKDAYGYEEYLKVSNKGRVYRKSRYVNNNGTQVKRKGVMASLSIGGSGYYYTSISIEGKRKNLRVHRVILQTFQPIDNYEEMTVNHKDGNKVNNDLENLEWMTHKENIRHAWDTGLSVPIYKEKVNYRITCRCCGKIFNRRVKVNIYCSEECRGYEDRKVKGRPTSEELYELLKHTPFTTVAETYGVSDNAIRKWCKSYEIPSKSSYYRKYRE